MKTLYVNIKQGKIVGYDGVAEVGEWDSTHITGNGWYCLISKNGTISCVASKRYKDGKQLMKFVLWPNKVARITLKLGDEMPKTIKFFHFKNWPVNGTISLPSGEIKYLRPFFKED